MRRLIGTALAASFFLGVGFASARQTREERQEKREERREERKEARQPLNGTFESYRDGILKILVDGKEVEVNVPVDFKTRLRTGDTNREGPAREHFRELRRGAPIRITWGSGDGVGSVTIGKPATDEPK